MGRLLDENDGEENEQDVVIEEYPNSGPSAEPLEKCCTIFLSQVTNTTIHQHPPAITTEMKVKNDPSLNQLEITDEEDQCLHQRSSSQQPSSPDADDSHREMVDMCTSSGPPEAAPSPATQHEGESEKEDIVVSTIAAAQPAPSDGAADDDLSQKNSLLHLLRLEREKRLSGVAQMEQEAQQASNPNDLLSTTSQDYSGSAATKTISSKKKKKVKGKEKGKGRQKQHDCSAASPPMMTEIEDDMEFLTRESERVSHERPEYHRVLNMTETAMRAVNPSWDPYYQPPAERCISTSERNKMAQNLGHKLQDLRQKRRSIAPSKKSNR